MPAEVVDERTKLVVRNVRDRLSACIKSKFADVSHVIGAAIARLEELQAKDVVTGVDDDPAQAFARAWVSGQSRITSARLLPGQAFKFTTPEKTIPYQIACGSDEGYQFFYTVNSQLALTLPKFKDEIIEFFGPQAYGSYSSTWTEDVANDPTLLIRSSKDPMVYFEIVAGFQKRGKLVVHRLKIETYPIPQRRAVLVKWYHGTDSAIYTFVGDSIVRQKSHSQNLVRSLFKSVFAYRALNTWRHEVLELR